MWRTFCLIFLGANVASAALLRHDQKVSRADGKVQEKDLLDMLTSLNEVVVGMDKEHKAFRDLSNARETSCRTTKAKLEKSLKDGNSSLLTAKQELSNAMSEVDSIQGGVDSIKKQVKAIDGEISGLQEQLAKLRADRQAAVARDSGYTQQVKAILEKAQQRISQVWTRSGAHKSAKSQEEESEDGASLVSLSESDQDDDPEKRTAATEGKKALAADAASVTKAAKKAREAFELQELKLLDLIKSKRQALKPLQGNLAKQRPELADQLRKISEANRSVAMTKHALKRDQKVLERSQSKCAVLSKAKKFEEDQRPQVRVQVIMAISFLKAMVRKAGIDLKPGAVGPSFLQLDSKDSELSEAVRSALHHIESLDDSRYEVNFHAGRWVQAEASNESDDAVTVPLESNLVQVDAAQKAASSEAADSLKNVKEMIANLIASLREEQNEDQGKQKFCAEKPGSADQLKKAQEKTKKLKTAQEEVEQSKRWAENAVNDLKVQSRFIEGEVKLLKEAKTSSKEELDAEEKRVKDEIYGITGECNTLAWLQQHPNIIQLRGAVHASQNYYVFMEFAGSVSLHNVLRARGSQVGLDRNMAHQVFNQIADAVAYCHSHGLAHCDLKPQNIVLNDDGIPKIVDFGLALKIGWPVGNPRGTWPFTAPEAAWPCGRPWDLAKADVFSLAAVLIEMLCGTDKPFRMFGWMVETPLNLLRVQEMVAFLATPGAVAMSLATDIGSPGNVASMITGMMNVLPMKRWSAKVAASFEW